MQERRRLVDLYQAGLIELIELQRRAKDIDVRHAGVVTERDWLAAQRAELASDNLLRQRVSYFARRTLAALDARDFDQRQKLLRLVIEQVLVTGSHIEIRYPSPLDSLPDEPTETNGARAGPSSDMRLRSIGDHQRREAMLAVGLGSRPSLM